MTAGSLEQSIEILMASTAVGRDPGELAIGDADLLLAYGPIDRHYTPLVLFSAKPCPTVSSVRA
jgi:hypothetical protein